MQLPFRLNQRKNRANHDDEHNDSSTDCKCMRPSATQDIGLSAFILIAPVLLLTAALLTFIVLFKIDKSTVLPVAPNKIETSAIYVTVDSTLLVFVSSWISSVTPFLTACAVTLATYPIAQRLLQDSNDGKHDRLLTSSQLSIAIKFVNGSTWGSLWNLFRYNTCRHRSSSRCGAALMSMTGVTLTMVALGIIVLVVDSWLHIMTKSVNLIRLSPLSITDAPYSSIIQPQCLETNNSYFALRAADLSCTINTAFQLPIVQNDAEALAILNNKSESLAVFPQPQNSTVYYLGVAPSATNISYDYTATTFAVATKCIPYSQECKLTLTASDTFNISYNCNNGALANEGMQLLESGLDRHSYRYANMSDYFEDFYVRYGVENPFYTAGAASFQLSKPLLPQVADDPGIVAYDGILATAVFFCNTTVFDAEYEVIQGQISHFETRISNTSVTNMFASATTGSFGLQNMLVAMAMAATNISSAQNFADAYANALSAVIIAGGATSVQRASIIKGQQRETILVSQVPKAPLFLLMIFNLGFVLLGVVLTIMASLTSEEARIVQLRLSIPGIVSSLFEDIRVAGRGRSVEQLVDERSNSEDNARIKVHRQSTGDFVFKSLENVNETQGHGCSAFVDSQDKGRDRQEKGLLVEDKAVWDPSTGQTWI